MMAQMPKFIMVLLFLGFISCKSNGQPSSNGAAKTSGNSSMEMDEEDEEAFPKSING